MAADSKKEVLTVVGKKGNKDALIELGNIMKGEENYDFSSSFNEKKL